MLPKQQQTMTLPTNAHSTMTSHQNTNFERMSSTCCTATNVNNQRMPATTSAASSLQQNHNTNMNNTTPAASQQLAVECVMPGIYLSKSFIAWTEENLRAHSFTHIIIIDKHIQELYYPSPVFKLSAKANSNHNEYDSNFATSPNGGSASGNAAQLCFSKEFEAIDLNFGEKSYLTTVLPNCYRAVKFINKALQSGGTILVIDCNGGEQKCLTIIVAFLMYKNNINFSDAFARLKVHYKKADLDRFYMSQLYEYEPILQVQRAQSRGHSCSRELHSALLKRKKIEETTTAAATPNSAATNNNSSSICTNANEFFDNLNPLTQFHAHQQQQQQLSTTTSETQQLPPRYNSGFHAWDDYVMD